MRKNLFSFVAVGIASVASLFATGCSSSEPYGLTGNQEIHQTPGQLNRAAEDKRNVGHVAGWRNGVNVPTNYR
jgi:hypothetical protein